MPASRWPNATSVWAARPCARRCFATVPPDDPRLAPASKGTYFEDPAKRRAEERLVEVLAADRAASRVGVAYKTSPPVTAGEREKFSEMLKDPSTRQRLDGEADRVSRWVADGAKDRLHARGMETV